MIKVFKIRTILKTLILLTAIVVSILVIKDKVENAKVVATSSNNKQKYKILVDVEDSKLYLFDFHKEEITNGSYIYLKMAN